MAVLCGTSAAVRVLSTEVYMKISEKNTYEEQPVCKKDLPAPDEKWGLFLYIS